MILKICFSTVLFLVFNYLSSQIVENDSLINLGNTNRNMEVVPKVGEEKIDYYSFVMVAKTPDFKDCNKSFDTNHDSYSCFIKLLVKEFDKDIKKTKLKKIIKDKNLTYRYFVSFFIEANGEITGLSFRTPNKEVEVDMIVTESIKKTIDRLNKSGKIKAAENAKGEKVKMIILVPYNLNLD